MCPQSYPLRGPLKSYLARHAACFVRTIDFTGSFRCRVFKIAYSDSRNFARQLYHPLFFYGERTSNKNLITISYFRTLSSLYVILK